MDVKNLRENLGISQNELAKLCGVNVRTIQNWEKGKPVPPAMELLLKNIQKKQQYQNGNRRTSIPNILMSLITGQTLRKYMGAH